MEGVIFGGKREPFSFHPCRRAHCLKKDSKTLLRVKINRIHDISRDESLGRKDWQWKVFPSPESDFQRREMTIEPLH